MKFVRTIVLPRSLTEPNRDMAHPRKAIVDSVQRSGSTAEHGGELQELRNMNGGVSVNKHSFSSISTTRFIGPGPV